MAKCRKLEEMDALHWLVGCLLGQGSICRLIMSIEPLRPSSLDRFSWVPALQDLETGNTRPTSIL